MEPLKAVITLSLRLMLRSRKTLVMALVVFLPVLASLLGVVIYKIRMGGAGATGFGLATELMTGAYIHVFVLAIPLFYATSLIGDEIEDKTITYLFVRPIPRSIIYLGKYLAGILTSLIIVIPSATLSFFILSTLDPVSEVVRHMGVFLQDLSILFLGILAYSSLFGAFGAVLKRPLLWGIVFSVGWEWVVTYIPGYIHKFTILHYLQSLLPHPSAQRGVLQIFQESTSPVASVITLVVVSATFLGLSCWVVSRREYLLEA
jgi:ABC-type transport system involved in multi-copper enzyme maturation permease subunit